MMIFPENQSVNPVVAEVVRSGMVESRHRGAVAGLAADGTQVISAGRHRSAVLPSLGEQAAAGHGHAPGRGRT